MYKFFSYYKNGLQSTKLYEDLREGLDDYCFNDMIADTIDDCNEKVNIIGVGEINQSYILRGCYPDIFEQIYEEELDYYADEYIPEEIDNDESAHFDMWEDNGTRVTISWIPDGEED